MTFIDSFFLGNEDKHLKFFEVFARDEKSNQDKPLKILFWRLPAKTFREHGVGIVPGFDVTEEFRCSDDFYNSSMWTQYDPYEGIRVVSIQNYLYRGETIRRFAGSIPRHAMTVHGIYVEGNETYFVLQNTWQGSQFIKASLRSLRKHCGIVLFSPRSFIRKILI